MKNRRRKINHSKYISREILFSYSIFSNKEELLFS